DNSFINSKRSFFTTGTTGMTCGSPTDSSHTCSLTICVFGGSVGIIVTFALNTCGSPTDSSHTCTTVGSFRWCFREYHVVRFPFRSAYCVDSLPRVAQGTLQTPLR